jgi:hypothetical protein
MTVPLLKHSPYAGPDNRYKDIKVPVVVTSRRAENELSPWATAQETLAFINFALHRVCEHAPFGDQDGRNVSIEYRWAENHADWLPRLWPI